MLRNPFKEVPIHEVANLTKESKTVSPKTIASTIGGALATILWTVLAVYVPGLKEHLGVPGMTTVTGATAVVFAAILGYFVIDPVRTATQSSPAAS